MKRTIYVIRGGGQRVQQDARYNIPVEYEVIHESSWVEECGCVGQDHFTNAMWSTELEDIQKWSNEWAGKEVELIEKEKED
ncbi:hypothetical protein IX307_001381 [Bacteroides pyogenes]|nr:hypothetical protein [Bacteroides pyogenes]MBR8720195.1 hypothetical protein [Bacteroides pyogenes]MBR8726650.1 hypothetical protein [Bacteroides pyogenes]MBR8740031.1 hypothetical protein [Bacteroides pyogenes]MBR8755779.1 hypothetical protein [Bacteroides pyogenes]MBR8787060.1 hypothetical protein [Bacteroides pyogenes]